MSASKSRRAVILLGLLSLALPQMTAVGATDSDESNTDVDDVAVGLSKTFYRKTCPDVTEIVSQLVDKILQKDLNLAGGLLRLHFHDCFVRGCDASVLLNSTAGNLVEKEAKPNNPSLRGLQQIDEIKAALELECPAIVSCADIVALVARDATVKAGGPYWEVALGRRDGVVSLAAEADANLPSPFLGFSQLVASFASKGLNAQDLIVLSGGHTIGRAHCGPVLHRLYNFTGQQTANSTDTDPSLDAELARELIARCPPLNGTNVVYMDDTPNAFDNTYYRGLLENRGLFVSDAVLTADPQGRNYTTAAARSEDPFFEDFAASMQKMGRIQLLTGDAGEVRKICSLVNGA